MTKFGCRVGGKHVFLQAVALGGMLMATNGCRDSATPVTVVQPPPPPVVISPVGRLTQASTGGLIVYTTLTNWTLK